jgi:hypothetical protein
VVRPLAKDLAGRRLQERHLPVHLPVGERRQAGLRRVVHRTRVVVEAGVAAAAVWCSARPSTTSRSSAPRPRARPGCCSSAAHGSAAYFRIQGPTLVIEYAPQGSVDHIHTIYRDPTNDYGAKYAAK